MSARTASPTAKLLRESRFFALPRPLPRPPPNPETSPTAPTPYPVIQAISTPQSSLARGDWGLKRPLPLRSTTRTSTPALRINAVDTLEHVTDFTSAADHTITLQKFQELNLPITTTPKQLFSSHKPPPRSVFEPQLDRTAKSTNKASIPPNERWKFDGPWLAGMTQGEFLKYVSKEVRSRREEFQAYLREYHIRKVTKAKRQDAVYNGQDPPSGPVTVTEQEFQDFVRHIRGTDLSINCELFAIVAQFLDLPGMRFPETLSPAGKSRQASHLLDDLDNGQDTPPSMHPSAGLSYLRSDAFLYNHPILGPQADRTPIQGRVLRDTPMSQGNPNRGKIGIAGFVAEAPGSNSTPRTTITKPSPEFDSYDPDARRDAGGHSIGVTVKGGNRVWVKPVSAHVDQSGRTQIKVLDSHPTPIDVQTGVFLEPETATAPRAQPIGVEEMTVRPAQMQRLDAKRAQA